MTNQSAPQTTDELRHDIDSGKTGDKADWPDPAAAPLGTDAEASGNTPKSKTVRTQEKPKRVSTPLGSSMGAALTYAGIAIVLLVAMSTIVVVAG